ncbi:unnamed protein product [Dovyalis caffra]|uniref:Uncharacterized protein n=1 Tax=Dovyalis caffra TaxID=77055 RepID=A0AAV1QQ13_9ROSI|nr:unnamed protein product [Dovyalis caffra]CAK7357523.1 unnamed protein product [Dovyalis caffra]
MWWTQGCYAETCFGRKDNFYNDTCHLTSLEKRWFGFYSAKSSESVKEDCLAWAARDPSGVLSPYQFSRSYID